MKRFLDLRYLRRLYNKVLGNRIMPLDRKETLANFDRNAVLHWRYVAFCLAACLLALFGLLLSSAAVVIGAMLISPLMAPISAFGIGIIRLDVRLLKKSLITIAVGVVLSIFIAALITFISPIQSNTPEILARTQPNLFDLMVAVVGGFVAGFATIRRTGETAIGVAIATALMPPLAVVGFSIATAQWAFAQGAFMLFMTNLLAIAACIGLMGIFYGLRPRSRRGFSYPLLGMMALIVVMSIPLTKSLQQIVQETYLRTTLEDAVLKPFKWAGVEVIVQSVTLTPTAEGWRGQAYVLTPKYVPDALKIAQERWGDANTMTLGLEQVVFNGPLPTTKPEVPQSILQPAVIEAAEVRLPRVIRSQIPLPLDGVSVDSATRQVRIYLRAFAGLTLEGLQVMEAGVQQQHPDWQVRLTPPTMRLPSFEFAAGSAELDAVAQKNLAQIMWALERWQVKKVDVVGYASSIGAANRFDNRTLARQRAEAVAAGLAAADIQVTLRADYIAVGQLGQERRRGTDSFQRVDVLVGE